MKILSGSKAIKEWFPDFSREPNDTDYIVSEGEKWTSKPKTEFLLNPIFEDYKHSLLLPNDLLTLKISHIFWDINWSKHMFDIQFLLGKGCVLDKELFLVLYGYWNVYHGENKRSDLKMSADDFFDNNIKCEHSHDYLHTLINPVPTYTKILIGEVEVGEDKFNELSYEDKCNLVYEEIEVMAYERYQKIGYKEGYSKMLKKFILSHAPIFEALFIIENYILLHKARNNYFKIIENGIRLKTT